MKNCLMVSIVFFDSEQLLTYNQPSKNASKYPKLAFQKLQLNIPKKIEKLAKNEKLFDGFSSVF